jgi:hypothetical protein
VGLGFSELFPITDGLETRSSSDCHFQQQFNKQTKKQWVGLGFSELFPITDGLEDEIVVRLPFPTTIQQTNKQTNNPWVGEGDDDDDDDVQEDIAQSNAGHRMRDFHLL